MSGTKKKEPSIFSLTWLFTGLGTFLVNVCKYVVKVLQIIPYQCVWIARNTRDSWRTISSVSPSPWWGIATGFFGTIAFCFWTFLGLCRTILLMKDTPLVPHHP